MFVHRGLAAAIVGSTIAVFLPLSAPALAQQFSGAGTRDHNATRAREPGPTRRGDLQPVSSRATERARAATRITDPRATVIRPGEPVTRAIHPGMPPRAVVGLRLLEQGRRLLQRGDYARALARFEKSLAVHATPYTYYYLAWAHYRLGTHRSSLGFIEVAESRLQNEPAWVDELAALRALAARALRTDRPSEAERGAAQIARQSGGAPDAIPPLAGSLNLRSGGNERAARGSVIEFALLGLAVVAITAFWLPRWVARRVS